MSRREIKSHVTKQVAGAVSVAFVFLVIKWALRRNHSTAKYAEDF